MTSRRLLVLDEQRDMEEVLKAVLEPSGTQVTRVRTWQQLQSNKPEQEGTVLVVHAQDVLQSHPEAGGLLQVPQVIIGRTEKKSSCENQSGGGNCTQSSQKEQQLDELFEFKDLLLAIDSLWGTSTER